MRETLGQDVNKRITGWPQIESSQSCSPFMWHLITIATYPAILKQRKPSHRYPVIGQFLTQSVGWSIQLPICTASGLEMDGVWSIGQATYLFLDRQGRRGSWFSCLRMLRDKSSRQDLYHIL